MSSNRPMHSHRHGSLSNALAAWANLSLEERIADRLSAIVFAADQILLMTETEAAGDRTSAVAKAAAHVADLIRPMLDEIRPRTRASCARDPELEVVLATLDAELKRLVALRGIERARAWRSAERRAAPYALALYLEVRRLDDLHAWGMPHGSQSTGES